jgi:hypothetical protein
MQILLLVRFAQHGCPTMETDKTQSFLLLLVGVVKCWFLSVGEKRFPRAETQERQATAKPSQCEGFKKDFSGVTLRFAKGFEMTTRLFAPLREIVRALVAPLSSLVFVVNIHSSPWPSARFFSAL